MRCPTCSFENLSGAEHCDACHASLAEPTQHKGLEKKLLDGSVASMKPQKALSISATEPAATAVQMMREAKVGCLLVMDGDKLLGVLSERTLLQRSADPFSLVETASGLMRAAEDFSEDASIADAFHAMAVTGHRHLPVKLKKGGYGVLSARDLLHYLCK